MTMECIIDKEPTLLPSDKEDNERCKASGGMIQEHVQINTTLSPSVQRTIQNFSLAFLTLQQSLNPIMVRKAHKANAQGAEFLSSTVVFTTEVIKLWLCCAILIVSHGSYRIFLSELSTAFLKNKRETLKVSIPALIYVVQNNLYFFALKRVEATLFSITYQLRILTTAILTVILLRRVFSGVQWSALFISLIGVICVQIANKHGPHTSNDEERRNELIGLLTVIVMCWTSAFAGVYLEGVLKKSSCDIWMQNIRLSVVTLPFAFGTLINDRDVIQTHGMFYGWNWMVWTLSIMAATSGIVVAAVMKYADNIKKSYCQSIALGGTALISIAVGDSQFSYMLLLGVSLVILSVFLYTLYPPEVNNANSAKVEPETVGLLDGEKEESDSDGDYVDEIIAKHTQDEEFVVVDNEVSNPEGDGGVIAVDSGPASSLVAGERLVDVQSPSLQPANEIAKLDQKSGTGDLLAQ